MIRNITNMINIIDTCICRKFLFVYKNIMFSYMVDISIFFDLINLVNL